MKKSTLKGILIAIAVIALLAAAIMAANIIEHRSEKAPVGAGTSSMSRREETEAGIDYASMQAEPVNINGREYYPNENISTLLLIGVDEDNFIKYRGNRNTGMSDFLVLVVFDNAKKTCRLLQINRNTVVDIPMLGASGDYIGLERKQIAYAHSYGNGLENSCENTVLTVSRMLYNVPVDNYICLAMGGIQAINDAVGGVTVKIEDDFTGVDDTLIKGQTVTLMGEHAEAFVRGRSYMPGDQRNTSRMRRQAAYMTAFVRQLGAKLKEDEAIIFDVYDAAADYLLTDYDINGLNELSETFSDYELVDVLTPEGENVVEGYEYFYLDERALRDTIAELFYIPAEEYAPAEDSAPGEEYTPVEEYVPVGG